MSNLPNEEELRRKVRKVFANRTHKFVGFKDFTIEVDEDQQKYRTIVAPYEPTIEKLVKYIQAYGYTRELEGRIEGKLLEVDVIIQEWQEFPDEGDFTNFLLDKQEKLKTELKALKDKKR